MTSLPAPSTGSLCVADGNLFRIRGSGVRGADGRHRSPARAKRFAADGLRQAAIGGRRLPASRSQQRLAPVATGPYSGSHGGRCDPPLWTSPSSARAARRSCALVGELHARTVSRLQAAAAVPTQAAWCATCAS